MLSNKHLFSILLSLLFALGSAPLSHADGLPVLQWETGKEQIISLRGVTTAIPWDLYLVGNGNNQKFSASQKSRSGSIIYSINLARNQALGSYIVEARSPNALTRQLAGINIVKMKQFNILQVPKKLIYICLAFIILVIGLSTMRASHYAEINYLRPTRVNPSNRHLRRFYTFRQTLLDDLQPSLLKFQLTKEGELFHNISPWVWAFAPFAFFAIGAYVGTHSMIASSTMAASVVIYGFVAILGVFDPLAGIAASLGFFLSVALSGAVTNLHTLLAAIAFVSGWFAPGIIASLFEESIRRDWLPRLPIRVLNFLPLIFAGFIAAVIFYSGELLTNSFSNRFGPVVDPGLLTPAVLGVFIIIRMKLNQFLIRDLHLKGENYQIRSITLPRILAPKSVIATTAYILCAVYAWTNDIKFSIVISVICAVSLGLLLFRFDSSIFKALTFFRRHIIFEALVVIFFALAAFMYVGKLPVVIVQKGEIFLLITGTLVLLHAIFSALHDAHCRNKVAIDNKSSGVKTSMERSS